MARRAVARLLETLMGGSRLSERVFDSPRLLGILMRGFDRSRHHSQYGQDYFVDCYFHDLQAGVFVEVGAFDGVSFSNTKYLEERGWTGIAIEPDPESYRLLRKNRSCTCEQVCAAAAVGTTRFTSISGYSAALSGATANYDAAHQRRIQEELAQHEGTSRTIEVPTDRLDNILSRHAIARVDYLSIDTEGGEFGVLQGLDLAATPVRLISVEVNYGSGRHIESYLRRFGFSRIGKIGLDLFFEKNA